MGGQHHYPYPDYRVPGEDDPVGADDDGQELLLERQNLVVLKDLVGEKVAFTEHMLPCSCAVAQLVECPSKVPACCSSRTV